MAKRNDSWGVEVGANAIKAMRLVRSGSNEGPSDALRGACNGRRAACRVKFRSG